MSVRRGPTEQDRSEGTLTKEGPNREQAPLVTWGAFPSNSPKAKPEAVRPTPLILILILILRNQKSSFTLATNCRGSPMEIAGDPNPLADV
jgi:hypothetical protein